ncbi:MAG TPA: arginine--tRNA ligase [Nitrososphaerales archaeon]
MMFREFKRQVKKCVIDAMQESGFSPPEFDSVEPPRSEFGDLSISVCLTLARSLKLKPMDLAENIASKIKLSCDSLIENVSVHPPGYINFKLDYSRFAFNTISKVLENKNYGRVNLGDDQKVAVEHTGVNPNKALHYGHLRNVVLGDSLARILMFAGYRVHTLNYVDDSGLQVADIIIGFKYLGFPIEPTTGEKFDHYCGDKVYVKVNEQYSTNNNLLEERKKVLQEIEKEGSEIAIFASKITKRILSEQLKTCWRIGARYDLLNFESDILHAKMWDEVFQKLKDKKIAVTVEDGKYAGCWIVRVEGEEEGEEKVLVRSDGTATYVAKDIPYAAWKLGLTPDRFNYEIFAKQFDQSKLWRTTLEDNKSKHPDFAPYSKVVTVIDVRQSRLQRIIGWILSDLSGGTTQQKYTHLGYEVVFLSGKTAQALGFSQDEKEFVSMSGRKGIYVNADDVLEALHNKAYEETKKRNPEETEEWLHETSEKVAIAAVRFELIKQDLDKTIVFDMERALDLNGETGPYLQYAYARASRLVKKAASEKELTKQGAINIKDESETTLLKEISKFDLIVEEAAANQSPKSIARYLFNLASFFNTFYEKIPVIREKDDETRTARIALIRNFQIVMRNGLSLLGIEAPENI